MSKEFNTALSLEEIPLKDLDLSKDHFYLLVMYGDLEPQLYGPYDSIKEQTAQARRHRRDSDDDGVYSLDIVEGQLSITAYSGGWMDPTFADDTPGWYDGEDPEEKHGN